MKTEHLFAIRQLIKNVPELSDLLFNKKLTELISDLSESEYFLTKAIYFDKPSESNWFVAYHQDLSISVDKKADLENYVNWTFKKGQYGVQPPIEILQDTITIRIHLDKTDRNNGALKVIPKSPRNEIVEVMADETYKIRIAAPPTDGKANAELTKFLKKSLNAAEVVIVSGQKDRLKLIRLS